MKEIRNGNEAYRQISPRCGAYCGLTRSQVAYDLSVGAEPLDRHDPEKPTARSDLERETAELRKEIYWLCGGYRCLLTDHSREVWYFARGLIIVPL